MPRLHAADVTARYRGERIEGRSVPLDNLAADLTVKDGTLRLHPLSFGVGRGRIVANLAADETAAHDLHVHADADFRQVDVARLLAATHRFGGAGTIGGTAAIEGTGGSLHGILADGNGDLKLFMTGGDLSALLVDLSGLELGNAMLSALGMPKKTPMRCLVADSGAAPRHHGHPHPAARHRGGGCHREGQHQLAGRDHRRPGPHPGEAPLDRLAAWADRYHRPPEAPVDRAVRQGHSRSGAGWRWRSACC